MKSANEASGEIRPLTPREFEQFRSLAYQQFGLDLRNGKEQLVAARLGKQIRELNFTSFQDYYDHILGDRSGEALSGMIDALATNHTSFFREPAHFDFLRETVIPQLRQRPAIAIWSAACSTGEEPYSIAFCLLDEVGMEAASKIQVLATDISTRVLQTAQKGVYPAERFTGISPAKLRRYVRRGENQWADWFLVKKEIRTLVEFRRLNLMRSLSDVPLFPVIFCRNVMIYFDRETQGALVNRLSERLERGGYLFVGHSESLNRIDHQLSYICPGVYRKTGSARK